MPMMTSQILRSVDFTKTQKSRYLEKQALFFLQIKKLVNYKSRGIFIAKNKFVASVNFKDLRNSQKFATRSFSTMSVPDSFNMYFLLFYIVNFQD